MSMFSHWAKKSGIPGWDKTTSAKGTIFQDFAAMPWTDRTGDEWTKFLKGDYTWRDYINPGGVVANPAQQIADPGNFFTAQEFDKNVDEGKVSDRTLASALVAGSVYGAAGAPGVFNAGASASSAGGSVAAGGASAAISPNDEKSTNNTIVAADYGGQDYSPVNPDYSSNVDPSYDNAGNASDYNFNLPDSYTNDPNYGVNDTYTPAYNGSEDTAQGGLPAYSNFPNNTDSNTNNTNTTNNTGSTSYAPYATALSTALNSWLNYKASQENTKAIQSGADKSADIMGYMFDKAWGGAQPYRTLGEQTLPYLQYATTGQGTPYNVETSPLYQWQKDKGTEALNRQLAARGLYGSGAGLQSLSDFYRALGAEETDKQYNRFLNAVNIGRGAQTEQSNNAMTTGQSLGNLYANTGRLVGQSRQGLYENIGNQVNSGLGTYLTWKQNQDLLNSQG